MVNNLYFNGIFYSLFYFKLKIFYKIAEASLPIDLLFYFNKNIKHLNVRFKVAVSYPFFLFFNNYLSITYLEPVTTSNAEVAENNNKWCCSYDTYCQVKMGDR